MKGQVEGSLTSNFKVIRQGHVIYFSSFGFYDLNLVENDTNLITLSHLHQKISRLTNNGKNSVFWPPSCTYDVMTYVTWQRQDDVTYVKMCLPSLVTDTLRRFPPLESSKKLQGKNARGGCINPWQFCSRGPPDPWGANRGRKPAAGKKQGAGKTQGGPAPPGPPHATGLWVMHGGISCLGILLLSQ